MFRYHLFDHIDEDDDTDDEDTNLDDESDGDEDAESDDDEQPLPEEDAAMLARLDKAFRATRARVRASTDLQELRTIRADHASSLSERLTPTVRVRTLDIIELVDDRVTDLRAARNGDRGR